LHYLERGVIYQYYIPRRKNVQFSSFVITRNVPVLECPFKNCLEFPAYTLRVPGTFEIVPLPSNTLDELAFPLFKALLEPPLPPLELLLRMVNLCV
jgi:hypothetical protein